MPFIPSFIHIDQFVPNDILRKRRTDRFEHRSLSCNVYTLVRTAVCSQTRRVCPQITAVRPGSESSVVISWHIDSCHSFIKHTPTPACYQGNTSLLSPWKQRCTIHYSQEWRRWCVCVCVCVRLLAPLHCSCKLALTEPSRPAHITQRSVRNWFSLYLIE